jgi:hypothetical protein
VGLKGFVERSGKALQQAFCAFIGEHDGLILRFCPVNFRSAARLIG